MRKYLGGKNKLGGKDMLARAVGIALVMAMLAPMGGCQFIGMMEESRRRNSTRPIDAEYTGLEGKTFAVLVAAPPVLQAEFPALVDKMTLEITARIAMEGGASGVIPGQRVIEWTYNRPNWVARPLGDVAKDLGVQRIVFVDVTEYRLNDKGNSYLWEGAAGATVSVVEADSALKDDFVFNKALTVKFPDQGGYTQADISGPAVNSELTRRLNERIAWLFFRHEEDYYPKY